MSAEIRRKYSKLRTHHAQTSLFWTNSPNQRWQPNSEPLLVSQHVPRHETKSHRNNTQGFLLPRMELTKTWSLTAKNPSTTRTPKDERQHRECPRGADGIPAQILNPNSRRCTHLSPLKRKALTQGAAGGTGREQNLPERPGGHRNWVRSGDWVGGGDAGCPPPHGAGAMSGARG